MAAVQPKRTLAARSWRYTLVGGVCALANYIIMLGNDYFGGHYLLGTVIAFVIVTPSAYVMHSLFTFAEPFRWKAFVRFVGGVASTYPVATGLMIILCSGLRLSVAIATPIATVAMFAWNFVAVQWSILPRLGLSDARIEAKSAGRDAA